MEMFISDSISFEQRASDPGEGNGGRNTSSLSILFPVCPYHERRNDFSDSSHWVGDSHLGPFKMFHHFGKV